MSAPTSIIMYFPFLFHLFALASTSLYNFSDITIQTTSNSTNIISSSTADTCYKLVVSDSHVFHLNTEGNYQRWATNNLNTSEQSVDLSKLTPILDFDANDAFNELLFLNFQSQSMTKTFFYAMNQIQLYNQGQKNYVQLTLNYTPNRVFVNGTYSYQLYGPLLLRRNLSSQIASQLSFPSGPISYAFMSVSYDYSLAAVWNTQTNCLFLNLTSMSIIGSYKPPITPTSSSTNAISFSRDKRYAIIETDRTNPLVILDLRSFTVIKSINIDDLIYSSLFLDTDNRRVVVMGKTAVTIFEIATNLTYSLPPNSGTMFGINNSSHIFSCFNNTISQMSFLFQNKTYEQSENKTTNKSTTTDKDFFVPLDLQVVGSAGQEVMAKLNSTLQTTTMIANNVVNVAISTPITVYFLGFLNFISTSSLYVLLNFPIPQQMYDYLSLLYTQLGSGLLTMMNINFSISPISDERVNNSRALYFGISSDLIPSNSNNFVLFGMNVLVLLIIRLIFRIILSNGNFINQLLRRQMKFMIYGQIISLLQPLLLPWAFVLAQGGAANFIDKVNLVLYIGVLCFCILFCISYFFELILADQKCYKTKLEKKDKVLKLNWNHTYSVKIQMPTNDTLPSKVRKTLSKLINSKVLEEWFLCQANIIFPVLVLLDSPVLFMMVILLHNIEGVVLAFLSPRRRLNNVLLACYPLLFHISFMVFYWCSSAYILAITQIVCLFSLLLGFLHNICLMLGETLYFVYKMIRRFIANNQVDPKESEVNTQRVQEKYPSNSKIQKLENQTNSNKFRSEKILSSKRKTHIQFVTKKHVKINEDFEDNSPEKRLKSYKKYAQPQSTQRKPNKVVVKKAKTDRFVESLKVVTTKKIMSGLK